MAYELELPAHAKIHPVFHVSLFKPFHGEVSARSYMPLPLLSLPEGPICQPSQVLDSRLLQKEDSVIPQALIQWDGALEPSWEDTDHIRALYPTFDLEDKVSTNGGSIVMTRPNRSAHQEPNTEPIIRRSLRSKRRPWKLRELEEI